MPYSCHKYCLVFALIIILADCRKPYNPPAITTINRFLVVDGIINSGAGGVTSININRTRNLGDTTPGGVPELHAQASIISNSGMSYPLKDTADDGIYTSGPLSLDNTQTYSLVITTSDNRRYASDPVVCRPTPLIDSIYYEEPGDFTVYADTHDPNNSTHYYRWDYEETWENDAQYQTGWGVKDHMIYAADSSNQKFKCYSSLHSTDIILASSINQGEDVIRHFPVHVVPNGDPKINLKYSMLVRQYALTRDAYDYWTLVQKTSQRLGTLFDLQPSQLLGNLHCLSNPNEPVIGFLSASSIQQQRIFVFQSQLLNWIHNPPQYGCDTLGIPVDPTDYRIYLYPDTNYAPYYFQGSTLYLASRICLDCTYFGTTNIAPPYWK